MYITTNIDFMKFADTIDPHNSQWCEANRNDILFLLCFKDAVYIDKEFIFEEYFNDISLAVWRQRHNIVTKNVLVKTPWGVREHLEFKYKQEDNEL